MTEPKKNPLQNGQSCKWTADEVLEEAVKAIKKYNIFKMKELWAFVPFSQKLYYSRLDSIKHSEQLLQLKEAINNNKISMKKVLQKKWSKQRNATTEIVLYKLCADKEELDILNNKMSDKEIDVNEAIRAIQAIVANKDKS